MILNVFRNLDDDTGERSSISERSVRPTRFRPSLRRSRGGRENSRGQSRSRFGQHLHCRRPRRRSDGNPLLESDPSLATVKGGPGDWDALTCLCFSQYLRLDEMVTAGFPRAWSTEFQALPATTKRTSFWSRLTRRRARTEQIDLRRALRQTQRLNNGGNPGVAIHRVQRLNIHSER